MSKPFAIVTIQGRPCRVEARTKAKLAEALRKYIPLAWGPAERDALETKAKEVLR